MTNPQFFVLFCIFFSLQLNAQKDTLRSKSLGSIMELIYVQKDSTDAIALSDYLTQRARREKDSSAVSWGHYGNYLYKKYPENLPYLDSLLYSVRSLKNNEEIFGLMTNGDYYFLERSDFSTALNFYLQARKISIETSNLPYQKITTNALAATKFLTGEFHESLDLYHRHLRMGPADTLALYFNIANCHMKLANRDSLAYYSQLGIQETIKRRDSLNYDSFLRLNGVANYMQGNLKRALDSLQKARSFTVDTINLGSSYYYSALSHEALGNPDSMLHYFRKIAYLNPEPEIYFPEIKNVWFKLYENAKKEGDNEKQLEYIGRFLEADSILESKSQGLISKVDKDYDLPLFRERKSQLIAARATKRNLTYLVVSLSILLIFSVVYLIMRIFHQKKRLKNAIGNPDDYLKTIVVPIRPKRKNDLPEELTLQLKVFLQKFENEKGFLDSTMSLQKLSSAAGTNTSYLSGYLNNNKGGYSDYINSQRVQYAFSDMPGNYEISMYTLEHIAKIYGFSSLRAFNRAFEKFLKIKPRDYLDQIKSQKIKNN